MEVVSFPSLSAGYEAPDRRAQDVWRLMMDLDPCSGTVSMRRHVSGRDRIAISNLWWPSLLGIPARESKQTAAVIRDRLDMGDWQLDHYSISQFWLCIDDLGPYHH